MVKMQIQADIADVHRGLEELGAEIKNINRKILRSLTTRARTKAKQSFRQNLNTKTGAIIGTAYAKAKNNTAGYVGIGSPLAMVHENGKNILAKGKFLQFQVDGKWIRTKSVSIPARPFFYPAVEAFAGSTEYVAIIEKVLAREIQRVWEK